MGKLKFKPLDTLFCIEVNGVKVAIQGIPPMFFTHELAYNALMGALRNNVATSYPSRTDKTYEQLLSEGYIVQRHPEYSVTYKHMDEIILFSDVNQALQFLIDNIYKIVGVKIRE